MSRITVIGSGASGVHFALTALQKGHQVDMIDVGFHGAEAVNPDYKFNDLKQKLKDPADYFLGRDFDSMVSPDAENQIYEFAPNKKYVFKCPAGFKYESAGFEPHISFAKGGLAEAWTGGCYPFNEAELGLFPLEYGELENYYGEVSKRIGIIGDDDDLARFYPRHENLLPGLDLDEHSKLLFDNYQQKKGEINQKLDSYLGRSRIATLSRDLGERKACDYSGRCMWGCPTDSLYVPSLTLKECLAFENFHYLPNIFITHFNYNNNKRITKILGRDLKSNHELEFNVDNIVLAAGTLMSSKIYIDSIYRKKGDVIALQGLMDNRQVLVPFTTLKMIGKQFNPDSYQYHQLAVGFELGDSAEYIHGQVTTLKTGLMQPVVQGLPFDLKTAIYLVRSLHSSLGVININLKDYRRDSNYVTIVPAEKGKQTLLKIFYTPAAEEKEKVKYSMKKIKKMLSKLGSVVPPGQSSMRPMGASVHYSGTIPMSREQKEHAVDPDCKSYEFENLFFVDGTSLPDLPAKNLTFTLMANATRVADKNF